MGPPWGAFCQITLTSCYYYAEAAHKKRYEYELMKYRLLSKVRHIVIYEATETLGSNNRQNRHAHGNSHAVVVSVSSNKSLSDTTVTLQLTTTCILLTQYAMPSFPLLGLPLPSLPRNVTNLSTRRCFKIIVHNDGWWVHYISSVDAWGEETMCAAFVWRHTLTELYQLERRKSIVSLTKAYRVQLVCKQDCQRRQCQML